MSEANKGVICYAGSPSWGSLKVIPSLCVLHLDINRSSRKKELFLKRNLN